MKHPDERIEMATATKRAGGEKRGNTGDRIRRSSKLSMAQTGNVGEIVTREIKTRIMRNGERMWVSQPAPFRAFNHCEMCGCKVSMLPEDREKPGIRGEQDKINPNGSYTMDNLQILCRADNVAKGNTYND